MERSALFEMAKALGFGTVGVSSTKGFDAQKRIVDGQPPLAERRQLRFFPQEDCPWASALLVLLWPYAPAPLPECDGAVFVDSYYFASNAAYHAARQLEAQLQQAGYRAKANVSFPAKEAAVRAGLGVIGHNGLLITPRDGTRVVIILMATDAITADGPDRTEERACLRCGKCVKACPTGAIDEAGMSHPEKCLRNFMMEGVVVPEEQRAKMGMKLIGCDNCQRACPMQKTDEFKAECCFQLDAFVTTDTQSFGAAVKQLGEEIGRNAARPQRVRAQAALLAGNRKNTVDLPVLYEWAQSEFEAVRVHARWAIDQMEHHVLGLDQTHEKR